MDLLERRTVDLGLTEATEADEDKDLRPDFRHGKVGVDLPPILLEECEDGTYLVRDGHHRRLIAIANGETEIEAYVAPLGWSSPTGSSFPYYHAYGQALVEWNGKVYDYGDMWSGAWRDGGPEDLDAYGDAPSECSEPSEPSNVAIPKGPRQCLRTSCCGPFQYVSQPSIGQNAYAVRAAMEQAGQMTLDLKPIILHVEF